MLKKSQYYCFIISLFAFSAILRPSSKLEKAVKEGVNAVEDLINNQGVGINDQDKYSETLLGYASKLGLTKVVRYLTQQDGIDLNKYYFLSTPLMHACENGHLNVVKELVKKGADATLVIGNRSTAIQLAAWKKHYNIVDYLLTSDKITWEKKDLEKLVNFLGEDTPQKTIENLYHIPALNNDIQQPIKNGQYEIVNYLVEKRKSKLTKEEINQFLPSLARQARLDKITELLQDNEIKTAFDPTTQDDQEQTFLDYLISYYRDESKKEAVMNIIKLLTEKEIIDLKKESKKMMLLAAKSNQDKLLEWVQKGGEVDWGNWSEEDVNRLFSYLAEHSQTTVISQLLGIEQVKSKFDPTKKVGTGSGDQRKTFIYYLFSLFQTREEEKQALKLFKKLVKKADIQLGGKTGKIAISLTAKHRKFKMLKWLLKREDVIWSTWNDEEAQELLFNLCEYKQYKFIKILYSKESSIGQLFKTIMHSKQNGKWFQSLLGYYNTFYRYPETDEKNILKTLGLVEKSHIHTLFQKEKDTVKETILSLAKLDKFKILKWVVDQGYITGEKWNIEEANQLFRYLAKNGEDGIFKQLLVISKMKDLFTISPIEKNQYVFNWGDKPKKEFFSDYLLRKGYSTKKQQKGKLNILKIVIDNNLINLEEQKEQINIQVAKDNHQRAIAKYLKSLNSSNLGPENESSSDDDDSSDDDSSTESDYISMTSLGRNRNQLQENNLNNDRNTRDNNNRSNVNNNNRNLPNHTSNGIRIEGHDDTTENSDNTLNSNLGLDRNQVSTDETFLDNSNSSSNNELNEDDNHSKIKFIFQVVGISAAAILLFIALPYHFFVKKKKSKPINKLAKVTA